MKGTYPKRCGAFFRILALFIIPICLPVYIYSNFGTVFVDQSYWQSSVAAKPKEGMWGFLFGGVVWFAVPFAFATTMGLAYIALSTYWGDELLTETQIGQGLVPVAVANEILGQKGNVMIVLMVLMSVTSTGSAEVIAITSILVYDLYQIHLRPYRRIADSNSCILCGKSRGRMANPRDQCSCTSMTGCKQCTADDVSRENNKRAIKPRFKCKVHGSYRTYLDLLRSKRDWGIVMTSISFIPLTLVCYRLQVNLEALYNLMGVMIGSSVSPIVLCMFWSRLTGKAMELAAILGLVFGVTAWLTSSIILHGEFNLSKFLQNSEDTNFEFSMLIGNLTSIISGACFSVFVSILSQPKIDESQVTELWEKTRDIDNPLSPWTELYIKEFSITEKKLVFNRPSLVQMRREFRMTYRIAFSLGLLLTLFLIIAWPALLASIQVFSQGLFRWWIGLSDAWAFSAAIFIIVVPVFTEVLDLMKQIKHIKMMQSVEPVIHNIPTEVDKPVVTVSEQT